MERGWRPSVEISPNCPRCGSSNTKFCYYNNYSLTQPRYFCKGCRRYWTKGGSLRNVPVGGGCRKNRRSSGKSVRLPIDSVSSKPFSSSPTPNDGTNKVTASASGESNGSHIDLALVYANFLNQQPENKSNCYQVQNLGREFDPCLDHFPTISNTNMDSGIQVHEGNGGLIGSTCLAQHHLSNNDHSIYYDRVQSNEYSLPPLPGEDLSSQDIMWSNSSPALQATQEPVLGHEAQDPNLLFGNWSPFDLSTDDTFSRT